MPDDDAALNALVSLLQQHIALTQQQNEVLTNISVQIGSIGQFLQHALTKETTNA